MANIAIYAPRELRGTISLPLSKSIANRLLVIATLCGKHLDINSNDLANDLKIMQRCIMGNTHIVDVEDSGTAMRFLTAYFATQQGQTHLLTGTQRLLQRPIAPLVEALKTLGATIKYAQKQGFAPIEITGSQLVGNRVRIKANTSSQFVSALMLIAPTLKNGLEIELEEQIVSMPYITLTLEVMKQNGACAKFVKANVIDIAKQNYTFATKTIEADWSAASYWYLHLALCNDKKACLSLTGLNKNSAQGDKKVAQFFDLLGVKTQYNNNNIVISKQDVCIKTLNLNLMQNPDLVQTLVVACVAQNITFCFEGVETLVIKETNRIEALIVELKKLGYVLCSKQNKTIEWDGQTTLTTTTTLNTHNDHRMAMSLSALCYKFRNLIINNCEVANKSYPHFFEQLKNMI